LKTSDWQRGLQALTTHKHVRSLPAVAGWLGLAGLLVAAILVRHHIPPIALAEHDSWGWLGPALNWIGGLGFHEEFEREWIYGAFLALCLKLTGSFAGYILIQQALGLAAAVLMWMTWRRWISIFPPNFWWEAISTPLGLFLIALYLFNPISLALELAIRPEAIMVFVLFLQLYCVVSFCKFRWQNFHPTACLVFGALSLPLAWAMFVLKPNWALAVPATILPVVLGLLPGGAPRLYRWLPLAAGFALIGLGLWLPGRLLFLRNDQPRLVLPMTLFTIHADIILASMEDEINDPNLLPERREFLKNFLPNLSRELEIATRENKYYRTLGFDPDYLMYRSSLFPQLLTQGEMSREDLAAFCRQSFLSALANDPVGYAKKVLSQMHFFVFPDDATFYRKRIALDKLCQHAASVLPDQPDQKYNPPTRALVQNYLDRLLQEAAGAREIKVVPSFRQFLRTVGPLSPAIGLGFFLVLAAVLVWPPLSALRLPGLVAAVIFSAPAGNALTVAMVHALDNSRYRGSYGPILVFALGAMVLFMTIAVTMIGVTLWQRHRSPSTPRPTK